MRHERDLDLARLFLIRSEQDLYAEVVGDTSLVNLTAPADSFMQSDLSEAHEWYDEEETDWYRRALESDKTRLARLACFPPGMFNFLFVFLFRLRGISHNGALNMGSEGVALTGQTDAVLCHC